MKPSLLGTLLALALPTIGLADPAKDYTGTVRPLLAQYCLDCHSTKAKKGSLDLERFATVDHVRKDVKPWLGVIEQLEAGEMPPKGKPQPTAAERKQIVGWVREFLDAEARSRAGDPGHVPLRRLSNAEFDRTIRDLTGVDLQPAREFPADGAAGEGFTNAAEALSDISPTLFNKYLLAAKEVSSHAVLLPDGFRFSATRTRRDWTDECTNRLREFYSAYSADGKLPVRPYMLATVRHRDRLLAGTTTLARVAEQEKLNAKYLGLLWAALTAKEPSFPLDSIRRHWSTAKESDVDALVAEIAAWQDGLWRFVQIGSYRYHQYERQVAKNPEVAASQTIRVRIPTAPGASVGSLHLSATDLTGAGGTAVWHRPRFEAPGQPPLLLRDYLDYRARYEMDLPAIFGETAKYLEAVRQAAHDPKSSVADLARARGLNAALLQRWVATTGVKPLRADASADFPLFVDANDTLPLLDEHTAPTANPPKVSGWRKRGTDLPSVVGNASNELLRIPGTLPPHRVAVHPTPTEYVAVTWTSPIDGELQLAAKITHAHPGCGNGVAWWIEHRRGDRANVLGQGALELGGWTQVNDKRIRVAKGDLVILAVDAKNRDHSCDLTEVSLTLTAGKQSWDLAGDVADTVSKANPHSDRLGNKDVWRFVRGPSRAVNANPGIPGDSLLGRWKAAAADPKRQGEAAKLAEQVQALFTAGRPKAEKSPDRVLYDYVVAVGGPLLRGLDAATLPQRKIERPALGLGRARFEGENLVGHAFEVPLPAALLAEREFVVDVKPDPKAVASVFQFQATASPALAHRWDGKSPLVAVGTGGVPQRLSRGFDEFRKLFPAFICYTHVIPLDEVVCLKMFHREDEPLRRLFLDDGQTKRLERLWLEHRFVSQQPVAENKYLPLFIGFVTQDQPKELLDYFEGQRPVFQKRADDFEREDAAAIPTQLAALMDFAGRAYRRPLTPQDQSQLQGLYDSLRKKGVAHDEALRGVLARVLVSPSFLFRIEQPPAGKDAGAVNDWELASRLSYFLWSSMPDAELRRLAAAGRLRDPATLRSQMKRMLADDKARALGIEFGAQWLHVRGFDDLKEKNESLFPTFNADLRKAIYEETILFFHDLFRADRPVANILEADYTFLNETLAKHYGIPNVKGPEWRRIDGVRAYGRGGILGLATIQTKESGASRTSPVLRGNWVVETLLGEKLPRPPANVPRLPEEEAVGEQTMRQLVEKHTRVAECATCHVRIDPFGFAFEKYDPIGRLREKDLGGRPIDARVTLRDGTAFDGLDGLRTYLVTKKKDVITRLFCRRLLGYALGRSVALSDEPLIDEMVRALSANGGRVTAAVEAIILSKQFGMIRGKDFDGE